jgi:hypothetical protein
MEYYFLFFAFSDSDQVVYISYIQLYKNNYFP